VGSLRSLEEGMDRRMELTKEELDIIRSWYEQIHDTKPKYLEDVDNMLYEKIKKESAPH
jgi:hypothetical protein